MKLTLILPFVNAALKAVKLFNPAPLALLPGVCPFLKYPETIRSLGTPLPGATYG